MKGFKDFIMRGNLVELAVAFIIAASFAATSPEMGICAAMPPNACAPRRWQVRISSSEYALRNDCVIDTCPRSGNTLS